MRTAKWIISVLMGLSAGILYAQTDLDILYDEALLLNQRKEFAEAARMFIKIQDEAYEAGDMNLHILSMTAEGECYYMLDMASDMKGVFEKAKAAYDRYSDGLEEMERLLAQEAISKLEGSYHYCMTGDDPSAFSRAQNAYHKCLELIGMMKSASVFFDDNELEIDVHRELLSLYYKQKQYDKALKEADDVYYYRRDIGFDLWDTSLAGRRDFDDFVDAYVARAMVLARLHRFDDALELLAEMPDECMDEASYIRTKGKILMLQYEFDGVDGREVARDCYARYIKKLRQEFDKQLLTLSEAGREQYWLAVHDFLYDCYCLGGYASDLLYDVALFSKGYLLKYRNGTYADDCTWEDIRDVLKDDECAVEFVQYMDRYEEKNMAALVVRSDYECPRFVSLGQVKNIMTMTLADGTPVGDAISYDVGSLKDALYSDTAVFQKIWNDELMALTEGCRTLYFAPDGFIHQLAVEYMHPDPSVDCCRLSSTGSLLSRRKHGIGNILLCGGMDYHAHVQPENTGNDVAGYNMFKGNGVYISSLKGAETEIDAIYLLKKELGGEEAALLKDDKATDEAFKSLIDEGYSIVHLATHGYFSGENDFSDLKTSYRDQSMSESGLIMAGAAANINDSGFDPLYSDGIITARELSEMDLSDVDLIVLSACQTGLGYITSDGVYGIQRALKIAGATAMIVSLWSVDDEATMMFMKAFYSELYKDPASGTDIYKAFNAARKQMKGGGQVSVNRFSSNSLTRKPKSRSVDSPRYSDAFILIDGI